MARYGGDEFAILLVETSKSGASCYAERIRQALADGPCSHSRQITASFGIARLPGDGLASSEASLRAAGEALYAAKRDGKTSVARYEPEPTFAQAQQDSPHANPALSCFSLFPHLIWLLQVPLGPVAAHAAGLDLWSLHVPGQLVGRRLIFVDLGSMVEWLPDVSAPITNLMRRHDLKGPMEEIC